MFYRKAFLALILLGFNVSCDNKSAIRNFVSKEVKNSVYVLHEEYMNDDFLCRDSIFIKNLSCKVFKFEGKYGLKFLVLYNIKKLNYSIVTYDGTKFPFKSLSTNYLNRDNIDIDMVGIENFLNQNYRAIDTSAAFIEGCDSLFRLYLNTDWNWNENRFLSRTKKTNNEKEIDETILKFKEFNVVRNLLNSNDSAKIIYNINFFRDLLVTQLSNNLSFIYIEDGSSDLFRINYRGHKYKSSDKMYLEDTISNFSYNFRIEHFRL